MIMYLPVVDGRPAAFDGDQLAFCDDTSYWEDKPHRARLYASLASLKEHIAASKKFRARRGFPAMTSYGWVEVNVPRLGATTQRKRRSLAIQGDDPK